MIGGITDASLRRVVVDLGGEIMRAGRLFVPIGGSSMSSSGAPAGFVSALHCPPGLVLGHRLIAPQCPLSLAELFGPSRRTLFRLIGHWHNLLWATRLGRRFSRSRQVAIQRGAADTHGISDDRHRLTAGVHPAARAAFLVSSFLG